MIEKLTLANLAGVTSGNDKTIFVEHTDGSYFETTRIEVRGDKVFLALFPGSVEVED